MRFARWLLRRTLPLDCLPPSLGLPLLPLDSFPSASHFPHSGSPGYTPFGLPCLTGLPFHTTWMPTHPHTTHLWITYLCTPWICHCLTYLHPFATPRLPFWLVQCPSPFPTPPHTPHLHFVSLDCCHLGPRLPLVLGSYYIHVIVYPLPPFALCIHTGLPCHPIGFCLPLLTLGLGLYARGYRTRAIPHVLPCLPTWITLCWITAFCPVDSAGY